MDWKKLSSNLIWIAALVFLVWFFLFPISLADAMPAEEGIRVSVLEYDSNNSPIQTVYYLPAASAGHGELMAVLEDYACYRTINTNGKNTDQSVSSNQTYLIQNDSLTTSIYAHGGSKVTLNDSYLRMGWFNSNQSQAFAAAIGQVLQKTDTGVVVESIQVVEATDYGF